MAVTISSCGSTPVPPKPILYVPIIDRTVCSGSDCVIKNECHEYHVVGNSIPAVYEFYAFHPLKKCDGIFGVDANDLVQIKDYTRRLRKYIEGLQANQCFE
jgi:hypothetical protein